MDLILWRHADAEDGFNDQERALTAKGVKQAERMAAWLNAQLPDKTRILVSPAKRAQQTAQALGRHFDTVKEIGVGMSAASLLVAAGWPDARGAVLVVGHQPTLGEVASLLMAGQETYWSVKKGAIWWFSNRLRGSESQTVLRVVLAPEMI